MLCRAAEEALNSGRKSVMPQDVFAAMKELEFDFMLPRLEAEVNKFTSIQADKRNTYRKKIREEKRAKSDPDGGASEMTEMNGGASEMTEMNGGASFMSLGTVGGEDEEPRAKKARMDGEVGDRSDEEGMDETQDVEDEEVEDDEVVEDEAPEEELKEDLLEEREDKEEEDDAVDGDESD
jgi:DNA polymerase epsilon subunit 3